MANRHNGEVSVTGESGKLYKLQSSFKGMVAVEDLFGKTYDEVAALSDAGSKKHLRALIWSLLQRHHDDISLDAVDEFVQDCGGLGVIAIKVMEAAKLAMGDPKDLEALGMTANPPEAQGDPKKSPTGGTSTSAPVASA